MELKRIITTGFILVITACSSVQTKTVQPEKHWQYIATTEDNQYEIFVNTEHKEKEGEIAKGILKYKPSKEKIKKLKEDFDRVNEETKKQMGYIPAGTEKIFEEMLKNNERYYAVTVDCSKNEVKLNDGGPVFLYMDASKPGFAEKIKKFFCD